MRKSRPQSQETKQKIREALLKSHAKKKLALSSLENSNVDNLDIALVALKEALAETEKEIKKTESVFNKRKVLINILESLEKL